MKCKNIEHFYPTYLQRELHCHLHNEIASVYNYMASINHCSFIDVFFSIRTYIKIFRNVDGAFVLR